MVTDMNILNFRNVALDVVRPLAMSMAARSYFGMGRSLFHLYAQQMRALGLHRKTLFDPRTCEYWTAPIRATDMPMQTRYIRGAIAELHRAQRKFTRNVSGELPTALYVSM
jgi:hypothetical protein